MMHAILKRPLNWISQLLIVLKIAFLQSFLVLQTVATNIKE